ncbi:MAG: lactate utilization protein C [Coriobacteriales bacterium]|nr:lactate utilization protein C [Coriobacteriales bacterium]
MQNNREITSVSLEEFLSPVSKALGHEQVPGSIEDCKALNKIPKRIHTNDKKELTEIFINAAKKMQTNVHVCNQAQVAQTLLEIIATVKDAKVVLPNESRINIMGLQAKLNESKVSFSVWDKDSGEQACCQMCLDADFGITFPRLGVAETGSILQASDANCGRSISLLPTAHVAIIDAKDIVAHMKDALDTVSDEQDAHGKNLPRQLCFISGPSVTSDIELVRVEGVHGPMALHYIIIDA